MLLAALLLATLAVCAGVERAQEVDFRWQHSLYPPYVDASGNSRNWLIRAFVSAYQFIRLTPDAPSQTGYIQSAEVPEEVL